MGGCASRPKDLDLDTQAPVEVPAVVAEEPVAVTETPAVVEVEAKPESATQEKTDEVEATEPLVDLSEVAPKTEETKEEVAPVETESETKVVVEATEEKKEVVA